MLSLVDLTINNDAENHDYVHNKTKKYIENIKDINSSNKSLMKDKYVDDLLVKDHQRNKSLKTVPNLQEHRNSSMERNTPKKSKKYTENTNNCNKLNNNVIKKKHTSNITDYAVNNQYVVKKNINKNNGLIDVLLENNYHLNESRKTISPKKKKKHGKKSDKFLTNTNENLFGKNIANIGNLTDGYCENIILTNLQEKNKKNKKKSVNLVTYTVADKNSFKNTKRSIENVNNYDDSNEFVVEQKRHKNYVPTNESLENNSYLNENHGTISCRKKKKHKNSLLELITNSITENHFLEQTVRSIKNINDKSNESLNVSLENNDCLNENHGTVSCTKKKKHKSGLLELNNYNSTENNLFRKTTECIGNCNSSANALLENNDHLNKNHGTISRKKNKKHKNCLLESINSICTKENLFENTETRINSVNNIDSSNESVIKKRNHKSYEPTNVSLENKDHINENHQTVSPKKKKKHDKSSVELMINSSNEKTVGSIGNGNESTNVFLENNDHLNENHGTISRKKKKKHTNCSFESVNSICTKENLFENTETRINSVNNIDSSNESVIKKRNHKSYEPTNVSLENKDHMNENHQTVSPKKEKKHDKSSFELMVNSSNEKNLFEKTVRSIGNVNDDDRSLESVIKEEKHKIIKSANALLESNDQLNKMHESGSDELKNNIGMEDNLFENIERKINIVNDIDSSNESVVKKNNHKSYEPTNVWLENKDHLNENSATISLREKKKHKKSSVELMITSSNEIKKEHEKNIEKSVVEFTAKNCTEVVNCDKTEKKIIASFTQSGKKNVDEDVVIYEDSLPPDVLKIVQNIKLLQNNFKDNDNNTNIKKKKSNKIEDLSMIENGTELKFDDMLNKDVEIESLLGIVSLDNAHETINSITSKNDILDNFNLVNYLVNSNPSIRNDCNFKSMLKDLSSQITKTINPKCKKSDIDLLKYIGEKMLKKVVEKHKGFKAIEHLHIELPNECKKNKMHFVETMIGDRPNIDMINSLKKLNPSLKSGIFNKEESDLIQQRWHKFQQEYNILDVQPFLSNGIRLAIPSIEDRLTFFRYISADLPNRLLSSVYVKFNKMFSNFSDKVSFFSKEEDEIIMKVDSCEAITGKQAVLSLLLNRSRGQLYRRIKSLKLKPHRGIRVKWDIELRQKLFDYILLETKTKNWRDLKNKTIESKTWIDISNHFQTPINYEQARNQWNALSTMLFCEKRINQFTFKLTILEYLLKTNPKYWKDVDWVKITNLFYPGASAKLVVSMFHWWVDAHVPPEMKPNIRDTLRYLSQRPTEHLLKQISDGKSKLFPRLMVKNNVLTEF